MADPFKDIPVVFDEPEAAPEGIESTSITFDIPSTQVAYDETRGKSYRIPAALTGREADHVIGTQTESRDKGDYFGLLDLGIDFVRNVGRGIGADIITLPSDIIGPALVEKGEIGGAGLALPSFLFGANLGARLQGPKRFLPESDFDRALIQVGTEMQIMNQNFVRNLNLQPTGENDFSSFAFNLGSGVSSVAVSIGLLYATKQPAVLFALFGARQKGQIFTEARAAGKEILEASAISTLAGSIEGGVEALGGFIFLKAVSIKNRRTRG